MTRQRPCNQTFILSRMTNNQGLLEKQQSQSENAGIPMFCEPGVERPADSGYAWTGHQQSARGPAPGEGWGRALTG